MYPFRLLAEKRSEVGDQINKLRNGLFKISDTREKVEAMSVELEEAKKQVAEFQIQCEEYLSVIVQQKREADKQQKASVTNHVDMHTTHKTLESNLLVKVFTGFFFLPN